MLCKFFSCSLLIEIVTMTSAASLVTGLLVGVFCLFVCFFACMWFNLPRKHLGIRHLNANQIHLNLLLHGNWGFQNFLCRIPSEAVKELLSGNTAKTFFQIVILNFTEFPEYANNQVLSMSCIHNAWYSHLKYVAYQAPQWPAAHTWSSSNQILHRRVQDPHDEKISDTIWLRIS